MCGINYLVCVIVFKIAIAFLELAAKLWYWYWKIYLCVAKEEYGIQGIVFYIMHLLGVFVKTTEGHI